MLVLLVFEIYKVIFRQCIVMTIVPYGEVHRNSKCLIFNCEISCQQYVPKNNNHVDIKDLLTLMKCMKVWLHFQAHISECNFLYHIFLHLKCSADDQSIMGFIVSCMLDYCIDHWYHLLISSSSSIFDNFLSHRCRQ